MKKFALAATTALVAAGSAAALEVTLGGEISTSVTYNGTVWAGPVIGGGAEDGITLAISGESMGWTYGAEIDLLSEDAAGVSDSLSGATVSLGSAGLGSLSLSSGSYEWSGMNVAGFDVTISGDIANIEAASFGLVGSLGGLAVDGSINNDATRTFNIALGTAVAGASVGINMVGNLADTSNVAYTVELGMSAMGSDLTIGLTEAGAISVEAAMGALTLSADLGDGDAFDNLTLAYSAELAEGLSLDASVTNDSAATSMSVGTTLSF